MKCIFPNYGEDCQYYCQCIKPKCHFSHGCLKKTATFNHHQISSMYKTRIVTLRALYLWFSFEYNKDLQKKNSIILTGSTKSNTAIFLPKSTTTVLFLKKTFSYPVATEDSSICTHKLSDTTANYFPNNTNLLNNNVFVGFFGVFVLSFIVFVIAFIYLIFFRKKPNSIETKESEWKAPYQSLHLGPVGIQRTPYPVSSERSNADSAYLSPVFIQNESSDLQGHDRIPGPNMVSEEQALGRQRLIHDFPYAENEFTVTLVNQADHVYVEIADDSKEN